MKLFVENLKTRINETKPKVNNFFYNFEASGTDYWCHVIDFED
jgi:hypothetical protein